ncbi:ATP-binding cassette domain-containing protein [Leucobacter sp. USCH14]|uniref:ATP-binding cassette domain-containing protein n=1 Tax=Leucobacter sp. USCH14 TaxID=3024838 RepID=UPI0030AC5CBF
MGRVRRVRRSPAFIAGAILTALLISVALAAPVLAPYSPTEQQLTQGLLPPSPEHWFGTDQLGRDVLSRMLFAARTDFGIAALAALAPFVVGVGAGLISGYFGGAVDWVASRVTDTVIAFPFYVIVIALVFALGAGAGGIVVAFALVGWVGYARVLRAMTAALRESGWVRSARGSGFSHARVLLRHVLPNVLPQAVVLLATEIVLIMVAIVTLGYLGLGIRPPTPDWGTMIADAQPFVTTQWWLAAIPGAGVVLTGIALSLLGDGIGDLLRVPATQGRRGRSRPGGRAGARAERRGPDAPGTPDTPGAREPRSDDALAAGAVSVVGLRIAAESGAMLVGKRAGIDLELRAGESLGIVGESGSGKSLTLRAMLGMLPRGTRAVDGGVAVAGAAGMVFQEPLTALDPLSRVGSQVRAAVQAASPGIARRATEKRVLDLLEQVRLPDPARISRAYPHELSGGQRQRVVIALALAGSPEVLLCDEPTTALDVTVQREVLDLLGRLRAERGLTLVFVSHDLAVVAEMCDRLVVMADGDVVETGTVGDLIEAPRSAEARALLAAAPSLPELAAPAEPAVPSDPFEPSVPDTPVAPVTSVTHRASDSVPRRDAPALLEVRDARVHFGATSAVAGVSLRLEAGAALGIVGESGSGKTTLARAIAGQLPLTAGEARLGGAVLGTKRSRAELRRIQLVPQDPYASLTPRRTVGSVLDEVLRVRGAGPTAHAASRNLAADRSIRVRQLLHRVGLEPDVADATPDRLSGGQRQRVAIARALAADPQVIVADEPTSALDTTARARVLELLRDLRDELGLGVVVISHDLGVVHELCDRLLLMRGGEVVESGDRSFFTAPRSEYGRTLLASVARL